MGYKPVSPYNENPTLKKFNRDECQFTFYKIAKPLHKSIKIIFLVFFCQFIKKKKKIFSVLMI